MSFSGHHLRRLGAVAVIAVLAGAAASFDFAGREKGAALDVQLGKALALDVRPDSLVWVGSSPSPDLATATAPRELAFLASRGKGAPADLYRAEVYLAPGPLVVRIDGLRNLTESEDGDDFAVAATWPHIAVVTRALGQIRAVTAFDVRGKELNHDASWSTLERALGGLSELQRAGRLRGFGRTSVRFERPPTAIELSFEAAGDVPALAIAWTDRDGAKRRAVVDLASGRTSSKELVVSKEMRLPKRPILWAVDTMRAVWWIGPGPIEWAEGRFFALKDRVRRMEYAIFGDDEDDEDEGVSAESGAASKQARGLTAPPSGLEIGAQEARIDWPPLPIAPPVFKSRKRGEGEWEPEVPDFARTLPGAPPSVYHTFVRTDAERPYARVELLAMDMRQLELHMVGGQEDPRPTTGTTGTGQIPRDRDILDRFVAAFNGAFKTEHGAYGMMVERNVLLPPQNDAATVATYADGTVAMGSWPKDAPIPQEMLSYRQNMDPLVEDGVVNPRKRRLWGYTLGADLSNMNTIRSGLCLKADGTMIYAWGEDLTAKTLGAALDAAGCGYAMHLDMNPYHTAYIFYRFEELDKEIERPKFESKLVFPAMMYSPWRYVNGAPKDFFFVAVRRTAPDGEGWSSEALAQPSPAFLPGSFRRTTSGIAVHAFAAKRVRAVLSPGALPEGLGRPVAGGADDDVGHLLSQVSLGAHDPSRGQISRGGVVAALADGRATLAVSEKSGLEVVPWSSDRRCDDALQGAWLVRGGAVQRGAGKIVGVGVSEDRRFAFVAEGPFDAVAKALIEAGATDAAAFEAPADAGSRIAVRGENAWFAGNGSTGAAVDDGGAQLRFLADVARPKALRLGKSAAPLAAPAATPPAASPQ